MANTALDIASAGLLTGCALSIAVGGLLNPCTAVQPPSSQVIFEAGGPASFAKRMDELHRQGLVRDDDEIVTIIRLVLETGILDGH